MVVVYIVVALFHWWKFLFLGFDVFKCFWFFVLGVDLSVISRVCGVPLSVFVVAVCSFGL